MSTYNGEKYLNKQLESIYNQTVKDNIEVFIRDDGSVDSTFQIIESWKDKLSIQLFKEKNAGPAKSFWKLMHNKDIQADYYAFCDQDDEWDRDKIESGINFLNSNKEIDLYVSNCRLIDENSNIVKSKMLDYQPPITFDRLFVSGFCQGCSMLFTDKLRKDVLKFDIKVLPMHDIVLMLFALAISGVYWDANPRFSYRIHSNNVVAKENKNIYKKIKTTYWNWKNGSKNSMSDVAKEIMTNCSLKEHDKEHLILVSNYRKSLINKFELINKTDYDGVPYGDKRSYIIRILLGLY